MKLCCVSDEDDTEAVDNKWNANVVCFTVETKTKKWANEISWSIGPCVSNGLSTCTANAGYLNNQNFTQQCCLLAGDYNITCNDCYGDGWRGGYLEINGTKYCETFTGKEYQVDLTLTPPKGITSNAT